MGDRRKLNSEIDRCLKKVNEGVEAFEDVWQKVQAAPSSNQKERYEQELKKEIKKLQRQRDQIKTWISSQDIKDKTALQEARKTIEQQMERFKVVEREAKTKAYSNGGLVAGCKLDPLEKEKENCMEWIEGSIRELEIQRDKFESDIESLSATLKKKKSEREKQERLDGLRRWVEKHNFHISSLQKILRAIDNEAIDLKEIQEIRLDIDYYVRSNQEPDFKENDMIYDSIDMDNLSTLMGASLATPNQTHPSSTFNGNINSSSITLPTLMDMNGSHAHSSIHITERVTLIPPMVSTHHGDSDSALGLTTTSSSTQASSPSASPALLTVEEPKKNKHESNEYPTPRHRSNSGVSGSSGPTSVTHLSSPKASSTLQQSPGVQSTTKNPLLLPSANSNSNASPHLHHPTSSSPSTTTTNATTTGTTVLPYAAIVSQSTPSGSSVSTGNLTTKHQSNILSPTSKQVPRQLSVNTNDTTVMNSSNLPVPASSSLLTAYIDRNGGTNSQPNVLLANVTTNNSQTGNSPMNNSNIPHETSSNNNSNIESSITTRQSPLLARSSFEAERLNSSNGISSSGLPTNGTLDGHGQNENNSFPNILPSTTSTLNPQNINMMSSAFLPTQPTLNDLQPSNNGSMISSISEHPHTLRYSTTSVNNQTSILNNRAPLSSNELRTLNRLNSAFIKLPSLLESERQRTNANRIYGRNPLSHSQINPFYPQVPPTSSDTPEFYYRLTPETLFFVFYYMEGTRAQYLAAKALKRQSWRFHTKHMMWFQRHEEPKTITDDFEQGTYIYFDYERWQTRKSENFMFEYKYLEDREY